MQICLNKKNNFFPLSKDKKRFLDSKISLKQNMGNNYHVFLVENFCNLDESQNSFGKNVFFERIEIYKFE